MTDTEMAPTLTSAGSSVNGVPTLRNYVGGVWVESQGPDRLESRDPATGALLAHVPLSSADDVRAAVAAARAAQRTWRAVPPQERARAILDLREALVSHVDELAGLVTREMGKTLLDARAEVKRGIESVEAAVSGPHALRGRLLEGVARGVDVELVRQPVGVVAAITPFNFPVMIPLWFLPFALVCGNAFVLKPSEHVSTAAVRLCELIDGVDRFPRGLVGLVLGARDAVNALLEDPGIDAVSFVGSAATARHVASRASANGKRVQALGGAKNSMIVMPDADPRLMAQGVTGSAFGAAGQRCMAGSVVLLVGDSTEQERSLNTIAHATSLLRVGPGNDPQTDVCPLVSAEARDRVVGEIDSAVERGGATVLVDGRGETGPGRALLGPTVLEVGDVESRVAREELFGPVLTVVRAPDLTSAIEWANRSRYGNSAILFSSSGEAARTFRATMEAGMLGVNIGIAAPVAWFPFSGWKDSFEGDLHANGDDAFLFYTRAKVVTSRWAA